MANEYRSGQGTIVPTLFIGMGGTGSRIVDRIAARAARLPNWESQLRPLTSFVAVDTNELDQHKLENIPPGNRLNISTFDKAKIIEGYRRSQDKQALQWIDRGYRPRQGNKPGAGQIRLESRLGFFYHSPDLRARLKQIIDAALAPGITWRQALPNNFYVYLYCTLAGGTGSGSFHSMAYLIKSVIEEQRWTPRIVGNLLLSTLMLDKVGPELHKGIHANTYAALKEIEHLTKLDYRQVREEGRTSEPFVYWRNENTDNVPQVQTRPFFLSFLFDRPAHLTLPDIEAGVADASFLQVFTPIIDELAGELDNYEKHIEGLTRFPGELKNVGQGYTMNFGAFGAAVCLIPAHDLMRYCTLRFTAEAIRRMITFGVDPNDASDDRARALARLAIDYSDPKFLNMGDEGRFNKINQAFIESVAEMARQDARQDNRDGFWFQTAEAVDHGTQKGTDDKGQVLRNESLMKQIERKLGEARSAVLSQISIKERAFVFHKEGVNTYVELVSRLVDDIREGRKIFEERVRSLEAAAGTGEVITDLKLDPIGERYLVLRLQDLCETKWLPEATAQLEAAKVGDVSNSKVKDRLEKELFDNLKEAAEKKRFLRSQDQEFLDVRSEAQEYYRTVARAAHRVFDCEARIRQLQALRNYLRNRARQYARLATQMEPLVQDLEREAERYRRGEKHVVRPFALRVEVFETLDEPRTRVWHEVYKALYLDEGRYLHTFDRETLAKTISEQLRPVIRPGGQLAEKTTDQLIHDIREAFEKLGETRLRGAIFGEGSLSGLDLANGLELEARIVLGKTKRPDESVTTEEIEHYIQKKARALAQSAGVLARVDSAEARAFDDGVTVNRTRLMVLGNAPGDVNSSNAKLEAKLEAVLKVGGRQVKQARWHDPRLAIVHDVTMPIPLYYLQPVTGEIEEAYLDEEKDERRQYNLHTDFNWEKSLPNLNPRRSEITVGWSLKMLARGLLTKSIEHQNGIWTWNKTGLSESMELGATLSAALYRLGEIHRLEDLQKRLELAVRDAESKLKPEELEERRAKLAHQLDNFIAALATSELRGENPQLLDRPVFRALLAEVRSTVIARENTARGPVSLKLDL